MGCKVKYYLKSIYECFNLNACFIQTTEREIFKIRMITALVEFIRIIIFRPWRK